MNNKGYALLDTLAALSIMLFISLALLPIWWKIENDRLDIRKQMKAQHVLYENLQMYYTTGNYEEMVKDPVSNSIFFTAINVWNTETAFLKGCVTYENSRNETMEICDVIKEREGLYLN